MKTKLSMLIFYTSLLALISACGEGETSSGIDGEDLGSGIPNSTLPLVDNSQNATGCIRVTRNVQGNFGLLFTEAVNNCGAPVFGVYSIRNGRQDVPFELRNSGSNTLIEGRVNGQLTFFACLQPYAPERVGSNTFRCVLVG